MTQLTAEFGAAYEDDVVLLTVPADSTYLAVLRTATAGLGAAGMTDWIPYRLEGPALTGLASSAR